MPAQPAGPAGGGSSEPAAYQGVAGQSVCLDLDAEPGNERREGRLA